MFLDDTTAFSVQAIVGAQQRYVSTSVPRCQRPTIWCYRYCHQTYHIKV